MSRIKVLIVEDQTLLRETLKQALGLEQDLVVVGAAAGGKQGVELARRLAPDVVLMDVKMPDMDGIEATRRIKQERPQTHVIVLTLFDDEEYVHQAIIAGADGYLLKEVTRRAMVDAVRRVAAGECLIDGGLMRAVLDEYSRLSKGQAARSGYPDGLTQREAEILRLVAQGRSNQEIADELSLAPSTVKSHLYNAYHKIGARDRVQATLYLIHKGL